MSRPHGTRRSALPASAVDATWDRRHSRASGVGPAAGPTEDGYRAIIVGICAFAGLGAPASVLICDDRPPTLHGLAELLRPLPSLLDTRCASDGFAIVDALAAEAVDLVLIGVHPASHIGQEAISLVLALHPSTVVVVVGAARDVDVLTRAYVRGARGMLLWEPRPHPGR